MRFASNCPQERCPPDDADGVTGSIIRFVRNDPPSRSDLESYADQGKVGPECTLCAVSVLRQMEDVHTVRNAMPWFGKRKVAVADLEPEHGVIKQTGSSTTHYSLWVERSHIPEIHALFRVVKV